MIIIMTIQDALAYPEPKQVAFDGEMAIVRNEEDIIVDEPEIIIITKAQIRIALLQLGIQLNRNLLQEVNNAVYASSNEELKIWWEDQIEYHSDNAKVVAMGNQLAINVTELFELAQSIKP